MEKIKGFVAWHPEKGVEWRTVCSDPDETWGFLVNEGPYGQNYESLSDYEFAIIDAERLGWRIRPVELRFTDEEGKQNE